MDHNWKKRLFVLVAACIISVLLVYSSYWYLSIPVVVIGWTAFDIWIFFVNKKVEDEDHY